MNATLRNDTLIVVLANLKSFWLIVRLLRIKGFQIPVWSGWFLSSHWWHSVNQWNPIVQINSNVLYWRFVSSYCFLLFWHKTFSVLVLSRLHLSRCLAIFACVPVILPPTVKLTWAVTSSFYVIANWVKSLHIFLVGNQYHLWISMKLLQWLKIFQAL